MGATLLAAKVTESARRVKDIVNVYYYLYQRRYGTARGQPVFSAHDGCLTFGGNVRVPVFPSVSVSLHQSSTHPMCASSNIILTLTSHPSSRG